MVDPDSRIRRSFAIAGWRWRSTTDALRFHRLHRAFDHAPQYVDIDIGKLAELLADMPEDYASRARVAATQPGVSLEELVNKVRTKKESMK